MIDCGAHTLITSMRWRPWRRELVVPRARHGADCLMIVTPSSHRQTSYDEFVAGRRPSPWPRRSRGPRCCTPPAHRPSQGHPPPAERLPFGSDFLLSGMLGGIMGFGPGDVYLSPALLYDSAPLVWSMTAQRLGGSRRHGALRSQRCLALIQEHGVTHVQFVPTMFVACSSCPGGAGTVRPLLAALGGARLRPRGRGQAPDDRSAGECPRVLLGHRGAGNDVDHLCGGPDGSGSVGKAIWARRTSVATTGRTSGGRGRRRLFRLGGAARPRSSTTTTRRRPARASTTRAGRRRGTSAIRRGGLPLPDDLKLFMIVSGGVNIYPQEIEDVLVLHPAVADVAVLRHPGPRDGRGGQGGRPAGSGRRTRTELEAEIVAFCRANSPTTSARARSTSPTCCPGARTGSSQEGPAGGLLGQLPPQHHLKLGGGRTSAYQARPRATAPKSSTPVTPTLTTGPMSRFLI